MAARGFTVDLNWLEDFEALAETGNFSRAAAARNVTQPAFSRRIRALEHWAGADLFERGTQPIGLTSAGSRIRPILADTVRRLRDAREEVGAHAGAALRFAATHALSFSFFPGWIRGLDALLPAIAIQLVSDGLDGCERSMLAGRAEFLICHHHAAAPGRLDAAGFVSRRVGEDRLRLVCAPDARGRPLFAADDRKAPLLGYGEGSGLARIVAALSRAPPRGSVRPVLTSHLAATLRTFARDGRGMAWLPEILVADDLAAGSLVPARRAPDAIALDIRMFTGAEGGTRAGRALWAALPE